jgi:hypothetical protein
MTHRSRVDANHRHAGTEAGIDRRQTAAAQSDHANVGFHVADELRVEAAAGGIPE